MSSWESYVRKVVPYVPGEQPQEQRMIKLNTNENPYPPAPGVIRALKEFDTDRLRLYPEPTCKVLVDAIAEYYGCLLYTSPSPRDRTRSRMPSSA